MTPEEEEDYLRTHPAFAPVKENAALPRVLIVGDSISIGYTVPLRELLAGRANVYRIRDNSETTEKGMALLNDWLGERHWDLVVFNFGLHDVILQNGEPRIRLGLYRARLKAMIEKIRPRAKALLWASSTPVTPECERSMQRRQKDDPLAPARRVKDIVRYNVAAQRLMEEEGIAVVDLHTWVLPRIYELQIPRNVHFTDDGYAALAQPVADGIVKELEKHSRDTQGSAPVSTYRRYLERLKRVLAGGR
jgi:lysophospholipase L1-like esterase